MDGKAGPATQRVLYGSKANITYPSMRQGEEGNSVKNLISIESPLGKALLHHRVGDTVTIPVSADYSYDVIIREIRDTSDEEDDSIRKF